MQPCLPWQNVDVHSCNGKLSFKKRRGENRPNVKLGPRHIRVNFMPSAGEGGLGGTIWLLIDCPSAPASTHQRHVYCGLRKLRLKGPPKYRPLPWVHAGLCFSEMCKKYFNPSGSDYCVFPFRLPSVTLPLASGAAGGAKGSLGI